MNIENTNIDINNLIIRYLSKEANSDEISILESWVLENPDNKKLFNQYRISWNLSNIEKNKEIINVDNEFEKLSKKLFTQEIRIEQKKSNNLFLKIAASLIFIAVSAFSVFYFINKTHYTKYLSQEKIINHQLLDGSSFVLDKNSEIQVADNYAKKERRIILKGDAFFEVKHNKNIPFIVEVNNIEVQDIGTSFYIDSKENGNVEIIVSSGIVSVYNIKTNKKIILNAGEKGYFDKKLNTLKKQKNNDNNYLSWKTKIFNFNNNKLSDVINKLNDVYNTNIELTNKQLGNCRLTAKFENKNIDAIINILKATFDFKIEKKNKKILISRDTCK